jgi:hypothetical protein
MLDCMMKHTCVAHVCELDVPQDGNGDDVDRSLRAKRVHWTNDSRNASQEDRGLVVSGRDNGYVEHFQVVEELVGLMTELKGLFGL